MAQFMKIAVYKPSGESLIIPIDNEETFEQFQKRVLLEHDINMEKEYFSSTYFTVSDNDNLYNFISTHADLNKVDSLIGKSDVEEKSDAIVYEVYLGDKNNTGIKSENNSPYTVQDNATECSANEQYQAICKEVENLDPLIVLNTTAESNNVLNNVLNENIFANDNYQQIQNENITENNTFDQEAKESMFVSTEDEHPKENQPEEEENNSHLDVDINSCIKINETEDTSTNVTGNNQIYNYMDIESKLREIHDDTDEQVTDLCRLCAKTIQNLHRINIYGSDSEEKNSEKINNILPINVSEKDGLPQQICETCSKHLVEFSEFVQVVLQADKVLRLKFTFSEENDQNPKPALTNESKNIKFEQDDVKICETEYLDESFGENLELDNLKCRFCDIELTNIDMSVSHSIKIHSNLNGLYICVLCDLGFTSSQLLTEHVRNSHTRQYESKIRRFKCNVCLRKYTTQEQLQKHTCTKNLTNMTLHCEICNLAFPTKKRLNFHRQFHLKNARSLHCDLCKITFENENEYFDHVNFSHESKQVFLCDICLKTFSLRSALNNHKKMHSGTRDYKCETCEKCFLNKQTLQEHEVCHMKTKPYQCHICGKNLNRASRLKRHLLTHESDPVVNDVHVCELCKESFGDEQTTITHITNDHSNENVSIEIISTDKVFKCEFCEKCYSEPGILNKHRKEHLGSTPYSCRICKTQFSSYARCTAHKTTHGIYKNDAEKDNFPVVKHFLCEHCGKSYLHWTYLALHRRLKHSAIPQIYKCTECCLEFNHSWNLKYHLRTKHQTEPLKCSVCEKYFANSRSLQIHHSTQHGDTKPKDVHCEKCGKIFINHASLENHMKTHLDTKEYKCAICSKSFTNVALLTNHIKTHQEIGFVCNYCGKRFNSKSNLEEHENVHLCKSRFSCDICDKIFQTRTLLNEHSKIHKKTRSYYCDICGMSFRRPFSLRNHRHKHFRTKQTGSFVLMVDMKEEAQGSDEKILDNPVNYVRTVLENQETPAEDTYLQLGLDGQAGENYIDIGNGNYLKVQGNTITIDGKQYILIDQEDTTTEKEQQIQMIVDEPYEETQNVQPIVEDFNNTVMLVESDSSVILNQNEMQQEIVFATDNDALEKPNTTYLIGNQYIIGTNNSTFN